MRKVRYGQIGVDRRRKPEFVQVRSLASEISHHGADLFDLLDHVPGRDQEELIPMSKKKPTARTVHATSSLGGLLEDRHYDVTKSFGQLLQRAEWLFRLVPNVWLMAHG